MERKRSRERKRRLDTNCQLAALAELVRDIDATDLAEEDFRLDTIPHVGSRDRQAVMARKLTQVFRNSPNARVSSSCSSTGGRVRGNV